MHKFITTILVSLLSLSIIAADYSDLVKINISTFEEQDESYLSINLKNKNHWHTYWENPGDSGLATEVQFKQGEDSIVLEIVEWPKPKRYIENGDIQTYGHDADYSFIYHYNNSFDENEEVTISLKWLVCKDICIPQKRVVTGKVVNGEFKAEDNDFTISKNEMVSRLNALPMEREKPNYIDLSLIKYNDSLALVYNITGDNQKLRSGENILTPYNAEPFTFKREKLYKDRSGNHYALYTIDWDGEYVEPAYPLPTDGKLRKPVDFKFVFNDPINGETYTFKNRVTNFGTSSQESFETFYKTLTPVTNISGKKLEVSQDINGEKSNLAYFLLMAFLGGLILNIMPCVLPVISLKLFGLIRHSNESRAKIFKHNLFYSIGVISTFLALAFTVILLKTSGEQVGWGFQLQSPAFVALMILIIFIMGLNLFGLFEFKTPGGSKLGNVEVRNTYFGDFTSGVLATILSTPCSAPFLGTALTFAFSESNFNIGLIFLFIGLGLSAPFILTGLFPSLIKFLPKPGAWMENVKKLLGLTLVFTVLWLLDVFSALIGSPTAVLEIQSALLLIFFAFYLRKTMTKKPIYFLLVIIPAALLTYHAVTTPISTGNSGHSLLEDKKREGLNWVKWSQEEMNKRISSGKPTFIDFTARWCITCKVNEKLVINTDSFKDMVDKHDVDLLLGDWTKKDPEIGTWLESQGIVGVPAYFVITKKGELIKLGETITLGKVKEALEL